MGADRWDRQELGRRTPVAGIEWNEKYRIGIEILDKEHKNLFRVVNKLMDHHWDEKHSEWACQESIKFFTSHAMKHFAEEEAYMESIRFPDLPHHRKLHDTFRNVTLPVLQDELERTHYSQAAVEHYVGVAAGWLVGHTLSEDMSIVGRSASKWRGILPGTEIGMITRIMKDYVYDMFNLESQLVSDVYGGERFGQGVYYRMAYEDPQGKRVEFILIFEEPHLVGSVGKVLGLETNKLDERMLHATRYMAQQFAEHVKTSFPNLQNCELVGEDLMSYNDFRDLFERNKPRVSLLFDSGPGYFAFCMITPKNSEEDLSVGREIKEAHATEDIAQFLMQRETAKPRPKVLIVDDSQTVRELIRELLRDDYEVSMAESGIAAIRALTLRKPDLVLLDYDMPIVDGAQTLQMFRQEKDFAKVPVVFLTGRSDPDSVRKLVSLKPQGFLLKHMEPDILKSKIDEITTKVCPKYQF